MYPFGDILTTLDDWYTGPPPFSRYQRTMPDVIPELPPKMLCDRLFESFVVYYHPVAPLIHIPSTRKDYDGFWAPDTAIKRTRKALCTPLIIAILFAGAIAFEESIIASHSGRSKSDIVTELHLLTAKTLRYANFPRTPTIESFAAYLIVQNTCMRGISTQEILCA
jgi:hypothetical protein